MSASLSHSPFAQRTLQRRRPSSGTCSVNATARAGADLRTSAIYKRTDDDSDAGGPIRRVGWYIYRDNDDGDSRLNLIVRYGILSRIFASPPTRPPSPTDRGLLRSDRDIRSARGRGGRYSQPAAARSLLCPLTRLLTIVQPPQPFDGLRMNPLKIPTACRPVHNSVRLIHSAVAEAACAQTIDG